jgi:hypothetical protein
MKIEIHGCGRAWKGKSDPVIGEKIKPETVKHSMPYCHECLSGTLIKGEGGQMVIRRSREPSEGDSVFYCVSSCVDKGRTCISQAELNIV